ncbi:FAD-binding oxidoreductase [uncultured Reyranella sp.]|uniref:NAD(P)/FAD-dependent oxidoreductase n=1 Tax=uncultured Reyranella sp. TaxID=735512 RepID=UPI0025E32337|nr:FAD-binding oxidoreductase [uncultured Reyranella sp.]
MTESDYPASWYAATRDADRPRPPLATTEEADVAVVGGGFAGLHTARLLARQGKRVMLLERRRIGWGASGRNGGFVGPGYAQRSGALIDRLGLDHARRLYAQSQRGVAIVRGAIAELGRPGILMGTGKLSVSRSDQGAGFADRTRKLAEQLGASFEPWPTGRTRSVLDTMRYHQAIHDPTSFHIHPLDLALALADDIERRGGRVHENTEAIALTRDGNGWRLRTPRGGVRARHVVLAGNADLGAVQPRIARAVLPVATYVAVTERLGPRLGEAIRWTGAISDTRRAGDYYRVVDGDRLLWGGRITTDTTEPPRLREMMRSDILSVYPQLGEIGIDYAWPGIMGYAPHKMPQVGEIEPGLWVCSAFGGHGVAQTAAGADAVAAGILGDPSRWHLFAPFGTGWAGGTAGRAATQLAYWGLQMRDWWDEKRQAQNAETLRT